ncbi:MAG: universal stress protein [Micromonosporaceae bacterium]|nr:universal stress protein [Micromonosporaceae bacterium]
MTVDTSSVTGPEDNPFELGTDGPSVILVGVDGSDTSLRAGAYAAGLARRQRAHLVVLYVAPSYSFSSMLPGVAPLVLQASEELAEQLRGLVDEASAERGVSATFRYAHGDPYTEIRRTAEEVRADAVVVGASSRAGYRFTGSLAVKLVRAGLWPVTVVP